MHKNYKHNAYPLLKSILLSRKLKKGYLLPTVIALGLAISLISIYSLSSVANNSNDVKNQDYQQLALDAAEAGILAAKSCLSTSPVLWSTSTPLNPSTNCQGSTAVPAKTSFVINDTTKKITSTYSVTAPNPSNGATTLQSKGTVCLNGTGTGTNCNGTTVATKVSFSVVTGVSSPTPTYSVASTPTSMNEGATATFTVNTTNFTGTLYWTINHTSTTAADFSATSGSFTVTNNIGSFNITTVADATTEGAETFTISIRTGSTTGTVVATSSSRTVNDTSTPPQGCSGTVICVRSSSSGSGGWGGTLPTHSAGNLILSFGANWASTAPAVPAGWTLIRSQANTAYAGSGTLVYKIATSSSEAYPSWGTDAYASTDIVLTGHRSTSPIGGRSSGAQVTNNVVWSAVTMSNTTGRSALLYFVANSHNALTTTAPAGYSFINGQNYWTYTFLKSTTTSSPSWSLGAGGSGWSSIGVEILAP